MEANELRIGIWVNEDILGNCIVTPIEPKLVWVVIKNMTKSGIIEDVQYHLDISSLNPIPLTEEWLLKFGFGREYEAERPKWLDQLESYNIGNEDIQFIKGKSYKVMKIRYVHQLQNLYFALTGKELEIINE